MNWFVTEGISGASTERKRVMANEDAACEHVEADPNVAAYRRLEKDTFGTVASYVCCAACDTKADEAEGELEEVCTDCGKTHKAKDGIAWKWYDFYAAQGDVALQICNECCKAEKHLARIKKDRADEEWEFAGQDDFAEPADPYARERNEEFGYQVQPVSAFVPWSFPTKTSA